MKGDVRGKRRRFRTHFWFSSVLLAELSTACWGAAGAQTAGYIEATRHTRAPAIREIDDPRTGARWLLLRDGSHPGGPGRLALAGSMRDDGRIGGNENDASALVAPPRPVIRAGDRLVVEEDTAVVAVRLGAVALGPAAPGGSLQARLQIGGKVVRVVAIAPGRAALATQTWVQP
ncbi:MAG: hypothetical protein KGM96_00890 [Acidobacteriota bacterium]|nr:hypothetical protein [Acidobacteriota bacterium]